MRKAGLLVVVLAALFMVAGCGQKVKKENDELKAALVALTGQKGEVEARAASISLELDEARSRIITLTAELDATKRELEVIKSRPKPAQKKRPSRR